MRAILLAAMLLAGCATVTHNTPSGKPEIATSASQAEAKSFITGAMIDAGFSIQRDTQFQIAFAKRGDRTLGIKAQHGHIVTYSIIEADRSAILTKLPTHL